MQQDWGIIFAFGLYFLALFGIGIFHMKKEQDLTEETTAGQEPEEAAAALKEAGFFAKIIEVLAVEVEDTPGALLSILEKASAAGLNIEYMYALTRPFKDKPVMVMSFKDIDTAEKLLS